MFSTPVRLLGLSLLTLSLCLLSSPCLAGAFVEDPNPAAVIQPAPSDPLIDNPEQTVVVERRYVPEKETPLKGSALGFYGTMPTVLFDNQVLPVEIGARIENGINIAALVRITQTPLSIEQGYLGLHYGAVAILDASPANTLPFGVFFGTENYLNKYFSLSFDLFPLKFGNGNWRIGDLMIGGRLYL